jgi:hypothetical protein
MKTLSVCVAGVAFCCGMATGATTIGLYHSHDFTFQATATGNPFDVELAGEFTGPEGIRIRVPGFYDGDGRWIIRFSPTREGEWELHTVSPLAALNGKTEGGIRCLPNRHAEIHGGLQVDPAHPYHFVYEDGSRYFLLGYEADWLWGADMQDPDRKLMRHLIDQMAARGFNHVIVNLYAYDLEQGAGARLGLGPGAGVSLGGEQRKAGPLAPQPEVLSAL